MYGIMKVQKVMLATVVLTLLFNFLPITACGHSDAGNGEAAPATRAGEITVTEIVIVTPPENVMNGIHANGFHFIDVNFTLAQELMNVNVTVNTTHDLFTDSNMTELGNLSTGFNLSAVELNFTAPGFYGINATVEGWLNGTGMVSDSMELLDVNFTTTVYYDFNVTVAGNEKDDIYSTDPIEIECIINYTGNLPTVETTELKINITNSTDGVAEPQITPPSLSFLVDSLGMGQNSSKIVFQWMPSKQGPNSDYTVKIGAMDLGSMQNNTTSFQIHVENLPIFGLESMNAPIEIPKDQVFSVAVSINNTGNSRGVANVRLIIHEDGDPGNEMYNNNKTTEEIDPESILPTDLVFENISVGVMGDFLVKAQIVGTAMELVQNLTIIGIPNKAPDLDTPQLSPAPPVSAGTPITFAITYTDDDDDAGNVTLYLNDTPIAMANGSNDWDGGVEFTHTWISTEGAHTYYFLTEDVLGNNRTLLDTGDLPFEFNVTPPTHGWLYGTVKDSDDNAVADADVIIYSMKLNGTGVLVIDQYFNTSSDNNGSFEEFLPLSSFNYVTKIDEEWLAVSQYTAVVPQMQNFLLDTGYLTAHVDFVVSGQPAKAKTLLKGVINDTDGNLSGVTITLEIFSDVPGEMNVTVEGTNDTIAVNITTRTWMNMTSTTDENGTFNISGIPSTMPEVGDLPTTSNKTYRHDVNEIPEFYIPGYWYVYAELSGYVITKGQPQFTEGKTTWWNATLAVVPPEMNYTITGIVEPANATLTFSGSQKVNVSATTGAFTILDVPDGDYKLTIIAGGYIEQIMNITVVGANKTLGTIKLIPIDDGDDDLYTIEIGPFKDKDNNTISNINISFSFGGKDYSALTATNGIAYFRGLTFETLPSTTPITIRYEDKVDKTVNYEDIDYTIDIGDGGGGGGGGGIMGSSLVVIIIIIVVIVAATAVIVFLIIQSGKSAEDDLFDDETQEYECPSCGATVFSDMDACPECGETFEEEEYKCPECGEPVEMDATECEGCGAEFEAAESPEEEAEEVEEGEEELPVPEEPEPIEDYDVDVEGVTADDELAGVEELADELDNEELEEPEDQ